MRVGAEPPARVRLLLAEAVHLVLGEAALEEAAQRAQGQGLQLLAPEAELLLEVVEVRLHDGGLAEGEGDVEFTLHDVEIPLDPAAVLTEIKANAKADPRVLTDLAIKLNDTSAGDPDFYYYRPRLENSPEVQGDYLYFIAPVDVRRDEDNEPVRPYSYAAPGFFRDEALTDKASSITTIDDDDVHEKVKVEVGTVLYFEDDAQTRFRVAVTDKPELNSIKLELTRLN